MLTGEIAENNEFISENLDSLYLLPGFGEEVLSNTNSILEMKTDFPKLKSVTVPMVWFATSESVSDCKIRPGVEKSIDDSDKKTWKVGNYDRNSAHHIYRDNPANPMSVKFGGTAPDTDVIEFFKLLKQNGIDTVFCPTLVIDQNTPNANKCWSGFISGKGEDVDLFFQTQYIPFILHYAKLLANAQLLDVFLLGCDLKGLNSSMNSNHQFPFVEQLIKLSYEVRKIVGTNVKISYAANCAEYHSIDGGNHSIDGGQRPLDQFWADKNVDFVGIDAFFPLTDGLCIDLDVNDIKFGWKTGEGVNYYCEGEARARKAFSSLDSQWKNLSYWAENEHWEWNPITHTSAKTIWDHKNPKPIWFTKCGFRSLNCSTNAPHLHGDQIPPFSTDIYDSKIQAMAIKATMEFVKSTDYIKQVSFYGYDSRGKGWQEKLAKPSQHIMGIMSGGKLGIGLMVK